ncbi:hypothetical protein BKA70DRAFT_1452810 [Coprinopsis sp. MPI-PUGE-AT-0042]|nr:hypothetical protein BKA70DRAFT_1452810 [Coprinopsis sp. MPI-PUGE-AT-0042]
MSRPAKKRRVISDDEEDEALQTLHHHAAPWRTTSLTVGGSRNWTDYSPQSSSAPSALIPCLVVDLILADLEFSTHWDIGRSVMENLSVPLGSAVEYVPFKFKVTEREKNARGPRKATKTLAAEGGPDFINRLMAAVEKLEKSCGRCHIVVVLCTHSMEDTGFPQESPQGRGIPVDQLFSVFFPEKVRAIFRSRWTILAYLACGTAWWTKSSYEGILGLIGESCDNQKPKDRHPQPQSAANISYCPPEPREYLDVGPIKDPGSGSPLFQTVIGFGRPALTLKVTAEFVIEIVGTWLMRKGKGTLDVLSHHMAMGIHTDVLFFQSAKYDQKGELLRQKQVIRCLYSHPRRPFGQPVPACPDCGTPTLKLSHFTPTWMVLLCSKCKIRFCFDRPRGRCWMFKWPKDNLPRDRTWLAEDYRAPEREIGTDEVYNQVYPPTRRLSPDEEVSGLESRPPTPLS